MAVQISGAKRESHRISGDFRTREKSAIFALTDHFDRPATYVSVIVSVQAIGAVVGVSLPLLRRTTLQQRHAGDDQLVRRAAGPDSVEHQEGSSDLVGPG